MVCTATPIQHNKLTTILYSIYVHKSNCGNELLCNYLLWLLSNSYCRIFPKVQYTKKGLLGRIKFGKFISDSFVSLKQSVVNIVIGKILAHA